MDVTRLEGQMRLRPSTILANLLSPGSLASSVITLLTCEEQLDRLRTENAALKDFIAMNSIYMQEMNKKMFMLEQELTEREEYIQTLTQQQAEFDDRQKFKLAQMTHLVHCSETYKEGNSFALDYESTNAGGFNKRRLSSSDDDVQSDSDQDSAVHECENQVIILEVQLEESQEALSHAQHTLEEYINKYHNCKEQVHQVQNSLASMEGVLLETKLKASDKEKECVCAQVKINSLVDLLTEKCSSVNDSRVTIQKLNAELESSHSEISNADRKINLQNKSIKNLTKQIEMLKEQVKTYDAQLEQSQEDFSNYQHTHSHTNEEYFEQGKQLCVLEYKVEECLAEVSQKDRQVQENQSYMVMVKEQLSKKRNGGHHKYQLLLP